jgi:tetratricopeptide (TPR) repeat protein
MGRTADRVVTLLLAVGAGLLGCVPRPGDEATPTDTQAPPVSVPVAPPSLPAPGPPSGAVPIDWPALRASEADCADCHPDEVAAWQLSAMGRSLLPYEGGRAPSRVEAPRADIEHPRTGQRFSVLLDASGVPVFREPGAPDSVPRRATWLIGSGAHTRSYLWRQGDTFFEAPLTWYPGRKRWALSPGYDVVDHPGMYREIRPDCLFCHADPAPHVPGTLNRYTEPAPGPIGCSRCHGDARAHVRARLAGARTDDPVMPSRLPPERRADVCNQCHFAGAVRLAREGRAFGEYLPPGRLEDSVAIFWRMGGGIGFGIASHAERLAQSRCGKGALGCTDCHRPHAVHAPGARSPDRSAPCRTCHGENHRTCAGPSGPDCVRCHMRTAPTNDIPHVAMTDHLIRADLSSNEPATTRVSSPGPLTWIARRDTAHDADPESRLLLARAYAEAARGGGPWADHDRGEALERLPKALADTPDSADGWADLAAMRQLSGDRAGSDAAIERAFRLRPADVRIARAAAAARVARGDGPGALAAAEAGLAIEPESAPLHLAQASALLLLGRRPEASRALERAASLRPGDTEIRLATAVQAELAGRWTDAETAYAQAVRADPRSVLAYLGRFRHAVRRGTWRDAATALSGAEEAVQGRGTVPAGLKDRLEAARALLEAGTGNDATAAPRASRLLTRGVRDPWAVHALGLVAHRRGETDAALQLLESAVALAPEEGAAWRTLSEVLSTSGRSKDAAVARERARRQGALSDPGP